MQLEKFYQGQNLHKEMLGLQEVVSIIDERPKTLEFIDRISTPHREGITEKVHLMVKKELQKIIKRLEKEFNDL